MLYTSKKFKLFELLFGQKMKKEKKERKIFCLPFKEGGLF